jgi:hypothetical protein
MSKMPIFTEGHGTREKALYPWEDLAYHPPLPQARIPAQIRKSQTPIRKNALIDYDRLRELLALKSYALLKQQYKVWIWEALRNGKNVRQPKWTTIVTVGNKSVVERIKVEMGAFAIGKKGRKSGDVYHLQEDSAAYRANFDTKHSWPSGRHNA